MTIDDVKVDDVQQDGEYHNLMRYWDDTTSKELREDLVKSARKGEIDEVRRMKVWTKVPLSQCLAETGKQAIRIRWVDRNKRDEKDPTYMSRIVAKKFKTYASPDLFATTPPVEYTRFLLSCVWQVRSGEARPQG